MPVADNYDCSSLFFLIIIKWHQSQPKLANPYPTAQLIYTKHVQQYIWNVTTQIDLHQTCENTKNVKYNHNTTHIYSHSKNKCTYAKHIITRKTHYRTQNTLSHACSNQINSTDANKVTEQQHFSFPIDAAATRCYLQIKMSECKRRDF